MDRQGRYYKWSTDPVVMTLLGLCVVMARLAYTKHLRPVPPLAVGENLSGIQIVDSEDRSNSLATGEITTLLMFNSTCSVCRAVAPTWSKWLRAHPERHAMAISSEPIEAAQAFATEFDLIVEVRRLRWTRADRSAALFAQGVPWLVVLGPDGHVWAHGHGKELELTGAMWQSRDQKPLASKEQ